MVNKLNIVMGDMAKVKLDSSDIYSGQVTSVLTEGVFVLIDNLGTKYVEWPNIVEVIKKEG